jgi:hypothetical protein
VAQNKKAWDLRACGKWPCGGSIYKARILMTYHEVPVTVKPPPTPVFFYKKKNGVNVKEALDNESEVNEIHMHALFESTPSRES